MEKKGKKNSEYTFGKLVWLMCIVLSVWLLNAFFLYLLSDKWEHRGAFGDMFGGINALFSGLAFAGIIFTILLQREELKLQRKELELTREELKRTASAQEASEKALSKQADTLLKTAEINAINTLLSTYQAEREARQKGTIGVIPIDERALQLQSRLDSILKDLEKEYK